MGLIDLLKEKILESELKVKINNKLQSITLDTIKE
jgi:hypothetical protein